jgi:GT2 family glycosyltransferase
MRLADRILRWASRLHDEDEAPRQRGDEGPQAKTSGETARSREHAEKEVGRLTKGYAEEKTQGLGGREEALNPRRALKAQESEALKALEDLACVEQQLLTANSQLEKYESRFSQQRDRLRLFERQLGIVNAKHAVDLQLVKAARAVRNALSQAPLGLVMHGGRLRAIFAAPGRPLDRADRKEIERSYLFDPQWYLDQNPDVAKHGIDPMAHYVRNGFMEDRDPHPLFNAAWYRATYRRELNGVSPLIHFLRNGGGRKRAAHPLFDSAFYLRQNKEVAGRNLDPLKHFIEVGEAERRDPHPLIWMDRLAVQPGLEGVDRPLRAYISDSRFFLASVHPLFDGDFYLHENRDVRKHDVCPLLHYCAVGWREGRQPHRAFAGDWYLEQNLDVLSAQVNPLLHFVTLGAWEDRSPHPLFDTRYYLRQNLDARTGKHDVLTHYITVGAEERRETTEKIKVDDMKEVVPTAYWRRFDPISAFTFFGETRISIPAQVDVGGDQLDCAWPPCPEVAYWLPQQLRDYIIERYGEEEIPFYLYLMSVIDRYGDRPEAFAESNELVTLRSRLRRCCSRARRVKKPDVSIIMPVYDNLAFTLTSALSLLENKSRYAFEVIIADDRSSDLTQEVFSSAGAPIVYLRQEKNLGFLGNCNAAAQRANGRYVVMLNNDTITLPGWLDELIAPMEKDARIGLTGSKLINADGTLQEAGGIFWNDGSAWNFGRNSDARLPEFNYLKDIDYISGASIALPTKLWNELEGFDPICSPAYCEDSDIAFRVRDKGLRTIYAPHSALVHHEGKSHGRDTSSGVKAYQISNQKKLLDRWRSVLEKDHFADGENVYLARDRSRNRPHILVVDHYIPRWDRDAGSRTVYHFLRMLIDAGFHVSFWPDNLNEDREYCAILQQAGVEVIYSAAYVDRFDAFMSANGSYIDYALVNRPHIAPKYYDSIRAHSHSVILYYGHDIHYKRLESELLTSEDPRLPQEIEQFRRLELENWRKSDVVLSQRRGTHRSRKGIAGRRGQRRADAWIFSLRTRRSARQYSAIRRSGF